MKHYRLTGNQKRLSLELDNRAKRFGVRAYAVHPGNIWGTELTREAPREILQKFGFVDDQGNEVPEVIATLKSIPQGAATTIWCATSPLLDNIGGVYCEDVNIAGIATGQEISTGVKTYSLDESSAKQLWSLTEELTGVTFNLAD
jgi:NAD(P)-dependent dehydrogenase (short-subunit alcohol dehydrogenase family)